MTWWWSWCLTLMSLLVAWLAGSKRRIAWLVGIAAQCMWLAYAVTTRQWGFIVSVIAFCCIYWRNWRQWSRQGARNGSADHSAADQNARGDVL